MSLPGKIAGNIWRVLFFANALITFLPLYPLFYYYLSNKKRYYKAFGLKKFWARLIMFNSGLSTKIIKQSKLDCSKAYIFCPNHSSILDIVSTYRSIPCYFHFMGKAELVKVPLFNIFFRDMNITVNRESIISAHRAFIRAAKDIDEGISMAIFPEAAIHECTPKLAPFKNGAFKLAIDKQIPIVPVTYLNNFELLPDINRENGGTPGTSKVIIHEPIETIGMTEEDIVSLKTKVFDIIDKTLRDNGSYRQFD